MAVAQTLCSIRVALTGLESALLAMTDLRVTRRLVEEFFLLNVPVERVPPVAIPIKPARAYGRSPRNPDNT